MNLSLNRRAFLALAATSPLLFCQTQAEAAGSLCNLTRMNPSGMPGLKEGSRAAKKDVADVLEALHFGGSIPIFASLKVANAAAFPNLQGIGRAIVYNPHFMTALYNINEWAPTSVIAHEIGHHIGLHQTSPNSHERELAADSVSGCALAWMGATEWQAIVAMTKGLPISAGTPSHPATVRRVAAIRRSFATCKDLK